MPSQSSDLLCDQEVIELYGTGRTFVLGEPNYQNLVSSGQQAHGRPLKSINKLRHGLGPQIQGWDMAIGYEDAIALHHRRRRLSAILIFVVTLLAFVVESQLTQYVQTVLEYRQPYFIFYISQCTYILILPLHIWYINATTGSSVQTLWSGLVLAISSHFSPVTASLPSELPPFPKFQFLRLVFWLTLGITIPTLLWFAAVSQAPISDVTAIWNTNAFFAYVMAVKLLNSNLNPWRLISVLVATLGVITVVYGGASVNEHTKRILPELHTQSSALVGDLTTLAASITYGLYQVMYKKYAALQLEFEVILEVPNSNYTSFDPPPLLEITGVEASAIIFPPPLGLYPNLLTSAIGLCTILFLWIPLPLLDIWGVEKFLLPKDLTTLLVIGIIAVGGLMFNAGLMILLDIWGPVITSVGGLLTIVLVLLSDTLFGNAAQTLTVWSLVGSCAIVLAFLSLAYDMRNDAFE